MQQFQFKNSIVLPILLGCLLLFSTCQSENKEENLPIAEEDMIEILMDALILEPAIHELAKVKQDSFGVQTYEQILAKKEYTVPEFVKSMKILQANPKRLAQVYDKVLEGLTKKEATLSPKVKEEEDK